MDEGRKRVILIAAAILAARKLCQYDSGSARVPATITAIADAVEWAHRIMRFASREKAILSQFEVGAGLVPGGGPMARLSRLMSATSCEK